MSCFHSSGLVDHVTYFTQILCLASLELVMIARGKVLEAGCAMTRQMKYFSSVVHQVHHLQDIMCLKVASYPDPVSRSPMV